MTATRKDKRMTTPTKIKGDLHAKLQGAVELLTEHVWCETDGEDWINNPVDVETVQVLLDDWVKKHFDNVVGRRLRELMGERDDEIKRELREEEETQKELTSWLQRGVC